MRPVLVFGAVGSSAAVASVIARACIHRDLACHVPALRDASSASSDTFAQLLDHHCPWLVFDAGGELGIDDAEAAEPGVHRAQIAASERLAIACATRAIQLVMLSSDQVFDGRKAAPYVESDPTGPLAAYGRTKLAAECQVAVTHPGAMIVRAGALFGAGDGRDFVSRTCGALAVGDRVRVANDHTVSPTYAPDLVEACLDLAIDGATGLWHLASAGSTTWAALAGEVAKLRGHEVDRIVGVPTQQLAWRAPRPPFSALVSARGFALPSLGDALARYCRSLPVEV